MAKYIVAVFSEWDDKNVIEVLEGSTPHRAVASHSLFCDYEDVDTELLNGHGIHGIFEEGGTWWWNGSYAITYQEIKDG